MDREPSSSKRGLAEEVWRLLFQFFMRTRPQRDRVLAELGLTPNDVRALAGLDAIEGRPMRALAEAWGCDASNATWIVDRLERLGLAERRPAPADRRIKLVVLTSRGAQTVADLLRQMFEPPPELLALQRGDLEGLGRALRKLPSTGDPLAGWR